ncbi:MAG: DAK2 domain-containing protein, partial [Thermomicrobiales bacterium]|nr:DAK2 domain-containing protein [Thermomicrobiales bacterium]
MHHVDPELVRPAARLLAIVEAAAARLEQRRDEIDALNVYPVPDGDTGSNMSLTMRGAIAAGRRAVAEDEGMAEVAAAMARGALLEARGNSGVILSQWLAGMAEQAADESTLDGVVLARALANGQRMAYRAVLAPQEGTMLSVARGAAEAAASAARLPAEETLAAALVGAREALRRTPEQLEVLRRAGVVDAGGQGLVRLLEG